MYLACANVPDQVAYECAVIDAVKEAGVARIVKLSGPGAVVDSPLTFGRWHGEIEEHLRGSGVPWVLLRPGPFMTNLLAFADTIQQTGKLFAPAGSAEIAYVDPRDVAASAAATLTTSGHEGRSYVLTGPAAVTYEEIAGALSAATGGAIDYVDVPPDVARQGMLDAGLPPMIADSIVEVFALFRAGGMAHTTGTVRALTGREPGTFAQFARDHAALFRPREGRSVRAGELTNLIVMTRPAGTARRSRTSTACATHCGSAPGLPWRPLSAPPSWCVGRRGQTSRQVRLRWQRRPSCSDLRRDRLDLDEPCGLEQSCAHDGPGGAVRAEVALQERHVRRVERGVGEVEAERDQILVGHVGTGEDRRKVLPHERRLVFEALRHLGAVGRVAVEAADVQRPGAGRNLHRVRVVGVRLVDAGGTVGADGHAAIMAGAR